MSTTTNATSSSTTSSTSNAGGVERVHDLLGIGLGPFNLGLAALAEPLGLDCLFLERKDRFAWHPGMLLPSSTLQVPFMADLVTMADPTSRYSFLNHLKREGRLYRFYIRESFYPLRVEFDRYCRWVADQLPSVECGWDVRDVTWHPELDATGQGRFTVESVDAGGRHRTDHARRLVLGTGTPPHVPAAFSDVADDAAVVHTADYLAARELLQQHRSVTVVGSGQSAAEVYRDLLPEARTHGYRLDWVTRSPRFFPLEYTKLTLEMTSPEYADYFHALPAGTRDDLLVSQAQLYKGIDGELVDEIYDLLYELDVDGPPPTRLFTGTACERVVREGGGYRLHLHHAEQDRRSSLTTDAVVMATGYRQQVPGFCRGVAEHLRWDEHGRFDVTRDYRVDLAAGHQDDDEGGGSSAPAPAGSVFVQNAEAHTHGFVAPDLGMAAYRNSCILRAVLGREPYPVERAIAFQHFGVPPTDPPLSGALLPGTPRARSSGDGGAPAGTTPRAGRPSRSRAGAAVGGRR
ncbi:MAG: SidA/IucD/PvdA family monooxygenase [Quadrisphaera sp.]